jgi:hypothetical protein
MLSAPVIGSSFNCWINASVARFSVDPHHLDGELLVASGGRFVSHETRFSALSWRHDGRICRNTRSMLMTTGQLKDGSQLALPVRSAKSINR